VVEKAAEEDIIEENSIRLVADLGYLIPFLYLSNYKFPVIDLLKEYSTRCITINQAGA
jgi:S-DNA-T family DNA segregation ATPase FtsK/SpoIIIE